MAAPNVGALRRVPGKLSHSPTDIMSAWPHGGTALATFGEVDLIPSAPTTVLTAEEWGGAPVDLVSTGAHWLLDFKLREYDPEALAVLFPFYAVGAQGGPILEYAVDGAARAGTKIGDQLSVVLVFTPENPDQHPMIIGRRAVPAIQESARMAMRGNESVTIAGRFYLTPNSSKKVFSYGRRRDLTL